MPYRLTPCQFSSVQFSLHRTNCGHGQSSVQILVLSASFLGFQHCDQCLFLKGRVFGAVSRSRQTCTMKHTPYTTLRNSKPDQPRQQAQTGDRSTCPLSCRPLGLTLIQLAISGYIAAQQLSSATLNVSTLVQLITSSGNLFHNGITRCEKKLALISSLA